MKFHGPPQNTKVISIPRQLKGSRLPLLAHSVRYCCAMGVEGKADVPAAPRLLCLTNYNYSPPPLSVLFGTAARHLCVFSIGDFNEVHLALELTAKHDQCCNQKIS